MSATTCTRTDLFTSDEDNLLRRLQGTWLLHDIVELDAIGNVTTEPYGAAPSGQLIYSPDGSVAVVIRAYGSSPAVAYAGRAIHLAGNQIRHVVHVGLPPYTEDQVRRVRLTDNGTKLALTTETVDDRRIELHWERGKVPGQKASAPFVSN